CSHNNEYVQVIRNGQQDERPVRFGNYASVRELAGRMATVFEADSLAILEAIVAAEHHKGLDTAKMLYSFIPHPYNFHWNTSGSQFVQRMKKEYDNFWTEERLALARAAK